MPLCDGSQGLTLRIFYGVGGQPAVGSQVRYENGFPSFAVDGQCRYFISGGWQGSGRAGADQGWRQGTVGAELLGKLEELISERDLSKLDHCAPTTLSDGSIRFVSNAASTLECGSGGKRVAALFDAIDERAEDLYARGAALDQGLHISAWTGFTGTGERADYAWPSGLALADYLAETPGVYPAGNSQLVAAAAAAPLRELREQYLSDVRAAVSLTGGSGIPVTDGEISAMVFLRDELPYENERGLWPVPGWNSAP